MGKAVTTKKNVTLKRDLPLFLIALPGIAYLIINNYKDLQATAFYLASLPSP